MSREASVRQRVARLVADGVMEITAVTNPLKLGFEVVCLLGLTVELADREAAGEALAELDEVTYLIACTGRYDYLVEVVCTDNKHLLEFMQVKLAAVPGVRTSESFGYLSVLKESYRTTPGGGRRPDIARYRSPCSTKKRPVSPPENQRVVTVFLRV